MGDLYKCERCHNYRWNPCDCQLFQCAIPWRGKVDEDDWHDRYAVDAEEAAEEYAEWRDSEGDYTIISNRGGEVWVRDVENAVTKWDIEAEAIPTYTARKKRAIPGDGARNE